MGQKPVGISEGPFYHGQSPRRAENGFLKLWWACHRIESQAGRAPGAGNAGPNLNEASIVGKSLCGKTWRFNEKILVMSRHGENYLGCPQWAQSPEVA